MKTKLKQRICSLLLCGTMLFSLCPTSAFAEADVQDSGVVTGGLCEHHPEHTEDCGYTERTAESPCTHEHTDECYSVIESCVHEHIDECYPQETVSGNVATPPNAEEEQEPENCAHVCSEESGCIKKELDCKHEHDEDCGYVPATEGTPCGFVCKECNPQDSGTNPADPAEKPETECICKTLCTEEARNADCLVCGAEGADLTLCKGAEPETATPSNTVQLSAGDVQKLIDELPTADELAAMSLEEQQAVYEKVQAAYEAYNALTDEQKAEITGAEIFDSLFDVFNGMVNTLADGSITKDGITITYSNGGSATYSAGNGFQITAGGDYTISSLWNGSISGAEFVITVSGNITANVTMQGLTIDVSGTRNVGAFGIKDNATVNLTLSGENSLKSGRGAAGLGVDAGTKLTIGGTGSLEAVCASRYGPGIGAEDRNSDINRNCGDITINSGTIVAIGGEYYPGIGSGVYASWPQKVTSTITINGGTVTAIGGTNAAGIGGALSGHGSEVIISGGFVTATGGSGAAGIGGGSNGMYGNPTQGTFSTGNNGNAVIIVQGGIGDTSNQSKWSGSILVIGGNSGIYGGDSFILNEDLEILSGNTLNIEGGKTLNVSNGVTLTNNGSITGYGTLDGSGELTGTGTIAASITNKLKKDAEIAISFNPTKQEYIYGETITITATISKAQTNAITRTVGNNEVEFFVGTGNSKKSLGTAVVIGDTATLSNVAITETAGWIVGENTITAEYGGSMGLNTKTSDTTLTVSRIPLSQPDNLEWNSDTPGTAQAGWGAVTNASGYSVQLYKGNATVGKADTTAETEYEFTISEAGTYTFKVKAIGEKIYNNSPESSPNASLTFHTVSFTTNSDTGDTISQQIVVENGYAKTPDTNGLSKKGHRFGYWCSDSTLTKKYDFDTQPITGNTTLYAEWVPITYNVTLNLNGGTINSGNVESYVYGNGATLPTDVTKEGYTFMGWYEDSNFSKPSVTEISATDIGEKTFYAKWLSKDASVESVTIHGKRGEISGNTFSITLPFGTTELPTDRGEVSITTAAGAKVTKLELSKNGGSDGSKWEFTVTAEDGKTEQPYTILVSIAPDPAKENRRDIGAAKSAVENHTWTVAQATANTEDTVKKWIEEQLAAMELNGASYTVTMDSGITPATAGTAGDRDGTNGSFAFTVHLFKGEKTGNIATSTYADETFTISNGTITATPYTKWTITLNAGNGGTVSGGGTFEENEVITVTATPNSGYRFVRWEESGAQASDKANYSFPVLADRTLTAVFERRSSGGGGGTSTTTYTLTFDTNGGSKIDRIRKTSVTTIDLTGYQPTREGYDFIGWYADSKLTDKITSIRLDGNKSVYAGWTRQTLPVDPAEPDKENPGTGIIGNPFIDVKESDWFYHDVLFVYGKGLMLGTSDNTFSPYGTATRGMMATILWRMEGSPKVEVNNPFKDVPQGSYYDAAIQWTAEQGIFSGYGGGVFGPDDPITRQQLATIFYNYAKYKGYDLTPADSLSGFTDAGKVSDWARDAMKWAVGSELMSGKGDGILDPQGTATRAEIAAMLHRFIEKYRLVEGAAPGGMDGWIDPKRTTFNPQTGDSANITFWAGMSFLSLVALTVLLYTNKRRDNDTTPFPT